MSWISDGEFGRSENFDLSLQKGLRLAGRFAAERGRSCPRRPRLPPALPAWRSRRSRVRGVFALTRARERDFRERTLLNPARAKLAHVLKLSRAV